MARHDLLGAKPYQREIAEPRRYRLVAHRAMLEIHRLFGDTACHQRYIFVRLIHHLLPMAAPAYLVRGKSATTMHHVLAAEKGIVRSNHHLGHHRRYHQPHVSRRMPLEPAAPETRRNAHYSWMLASPSRKSQYAYYRRRDNKLSKCLSIASARRACAKSWLPSTVETILSSIVILSRVTSKLLAYAIMKASAAANLGGRSI